MKNFIIGFHRKIRILGGGEGFKKTIYRGNFLKRGARTVFRFKGGGLAMHNNPMHTMNLVFYGWGRLYNLLETMLYYLTLLSL